MCKGIGISGEKNLNWNAVIAERQIASKSDKTSTVTIKNLLSSFRYLAKSAFNFCIYSLVG